MRKILDKLIAKLDSRLEQGRQNNPLSESIKGWFMFGNYKVSYILDEDECTLDIFHPIRGIFLPNVEAYCSSRCLCWSQIDVDEESNEWNINGFSNESDYLRYRYG